MPKGRFDGFLIKDDGSMTPLSSERKFLLTGKSGKVWLAVYSPDGDYVCVELDDEDVTRLHQQLLKLPPRPIPAGQEADGVR